MHGSLDLSALRIGFMALLIRFALISHWIWVLCALALGLYALGLHGCFAHWVWVLCVLGVDVLCIDLGASRIDVRYSLRWIWKLCTLG